LQKLPIIGFAAANSAAAPLFDAAIVADLRIQDRAIEASAAAL
jgi:hypothetical protein